MRAEDFNFLFRQAEGAISAREWRFWTIVLSLICVGLEVVWRLVRPWTHRDLATEGLFSLKAFVAFSYLLIFAFGVLLAQASQYYLSAKRFRARGYDPGWAAVWPLSAFAAGAVSAMQPYMYGLMPDYLPWLFLFASAAVFAGQFYELGLRGD